MPDPVQQLGTPPLRPVWATARKTAESEAAKLKEAEKFSETRKKMKGDLGPELESWPKLFPNFEKLKSAKLKIDGTIKQYSEAVKGSGMSDKVKKPMLEALTTVKDAMEDRLDKAEKFILADEKLQMKLAISASKKKQIAPLVIVKQDVGKQVAEKAGKGAGRLTVEQIPLEIILSDSAVLKNVPNDLDDAVLAKEIRIGANFTLVIDELAKLLIQVAKDVHAEKDVPVAEKKFAEGMDKIVEAALQRAAKPILELTEVRSDYRMYKIKAGVNLGLTISGAVGSAIAIGTAPLTAASGVIVGMIGLVQAGISIGKQLADLKLEAEGIANRVANGLKTLNSQYKEASSTLVGVGEMAKTLVSASIPGAITTIKSVQGDCGLLESKVQGLTVKTHDEAQNLGKILQGQAKLQAELSKFEQSSKAKLNPAEIQKFTKLMQLVDSLAPKVEDSMKKIGTLDVRVKEMAASHKTLSDAVNVIAAKKPVWAEVGEILLGAAVTAGWMAGGNVNVPNAHKGLEMVNTVTTQLGNATGALSAAKDLVLDLKDTIQERVGG